MTVRRNNANATSNYFDALMQGIGHRGSSFMDLDNTALYVTQDKETGRALVQEFKREGEPQMSSGQRICLEWLARRPGFTVWVCVKRNDGRIGFTHIGRTNELVLSETQYQQRVRAWWQQVAIDLGPAAAAVVRPEFVEPGAEQCNKCGATLPEWPRQALLVCKACWRGHNGLPPTGAS